MNKYALKSHAKFKSRTEKRVIIGGDTDFCAERFGYRRGKNGISPAPAFRSVSPTISADSVLFSEYLPVGSRSFYVLGNGRLMSLNTAAKSPLTLEGTVTTKFPSVLHTIINNQYYNVIVSGNKLAFIKGTAKATVMTVSVTLKNSVLHCGRLFGIDDTDEYMLRWSGYALQNWTEGVDGAGYVRLKPRLGKLLNLFVLGEKIIIVREAGISVLSVLGDSRHMRLDVCDKYELPRVYVNSSAICRGQLWIFTQKGMRVFDGDSVSVAPVDDFAIGYVLNHAKVVDDRYIYYSATKGSDKCLFEYDVETGACTLFAGGCHSPYFVENNAYAFSGRILGNILPNIEDGNRRWVSKPVTFDEGKKAVLKSLTVEGSGNFTVETDCDGRKLYSAGAGRFRFAESGQSFIFRVTGNGSVTSLTAEWEVC